jgi:uncharacterized protein
MGRIHDSGDWDDRLAFRRELYERFSPAPTALSADGREVELQGPVEVGFVVGGFVVVEPAGDGDPLVVQIVEVRVEDRSGPELIGSVPLGSPGATVDSVTFRPSLRVVTARGVILGCLLPAGFSRADRVQPFGERLARPATPVGLDSVVAALHDGVATLGIGTLRQAPAVRAELVSRGFARHTFLCGQSGSGKTYTTGAIFERLLAETELPLVVLDPNSDHVHLGRLADPDEDSDEARRYRAVAPTVAVARARGFDADVTLCADFSDLPLDWQALVLRLHPIADAGEFDALRRITTGLTAPYTVVDVLDAAAEGGPADGAAQAIAHRITNLGIPSWEVWRRADEQSIAGLQLRDHRCVVFDLGSLSTPDERTIVALALLGTRWARRTMRQPVLIAIDEAHNVLPAATDDLLQRATADLGVLIAGEGRKFGLHLFVASQRPAKVHPNVLSQCDNLILMRMNGVADVDDLVQRFSHVPAAMLHEATRFGLGEALLAGPISPIPAFARIGRRLTPEGGGDVPTTWASSPATSAEHPDR